MEYQGCFLGTMFCCVGELNIRGVSWELCSVVLVSGISGVFPGDYVQLCRWVEYQGCFLGTMFSCVGEWSIRGVSWKLFSVV